MTSPTIGPRSYSSIPGDKKLRIYRMMLDACIFEEKAHELFFEEVVKEGAFYDLDGPTRRITTPQMPLPSADFLEDMAMPSTELITAELRELTNG